MSDSPHPPKDAPRTVPVRRSRAVPVVIPSGRPEEDPPPSVKGAPSAPKPRVVGARSPNETGMLAVGPGGAEAPPSADPSATAFFALPAPPSRAEKPRTPPPTPVAVTPVVAPPVITGPVSAPAPAAPAPAVGPEGRVVSWRVWALLLTVFALMGLFVLGVLGVWFWQNREGTAVVVTEPTPVTVPTTASPPLVEEPAADPIVITSSGARPRPRPTPVAPVATPAPVAPAPAPVATTGTVVVSFAGDSVPSSLEVVCNSTGFRDRRPVSGNRVVVPDVPVGVGCQGVPKGIPASNFTVKAGGTYACAIVGTTTSCN